MHAKSPRSKPAPADHPLHELITRRWSPYGFEPQPVAPADLAALFEAARWAPSCFNDQPWRFLVATREQPDEYERMLSCLVEGNQGWARSAPVLGLGIAHERFARNDKSNRHAQHDLGLAIAHLTLEATARGLAVHCMGGILPDRARELYGVPEHHSVLVGMAIGTPVRDPSTLSEALAERERAPRERRPLHDTVFSGQWGQAPGWTLRPPTGR